MSGRSKTISIVGGGLAGSECAWQLAERGHRVVLYEQRRPLKSSGEVDTSSLTPAHRTSKLAELVCSNSLGSQTDYSAPGQLKWEAERANSLILRAAREAAVPAGMALGVDREIFATAVTQALENHPNIEIRRERVDSLDQIERPAVIATGPLTSESLAHSICDHLRSSESEEDFLYFFDAIAPVIDADTIDMSIAFRANRWDKSVSNGNFDSVAKDKRNVVAATANAKVSANEGHQSEQTGDYINCPLDKDQYFALIEAIKAARKIEPKEFEKDTPFFEGCMPIEAMVERGPLTPRFGPMSPKGLVNPHTGRKAFAIVQLRQENLDATAYNMVGFQTKMAYGEQQRVFRMIPGLENAEFLKLGSIHRNLYIHSPRKLTKYLSSPRDPNLFFAGQMTGVEGYFDSTCIGLLVALFLDDLMAGREIYLPPRESAFGSLLNAITEPKDVFQPTNINFGLFPLLGMEVRTKEDRQLKRERQLERAKESFQKWWSQKTGTLDCGDRPLKF